MGTLHMLAERRARRAMQLGVTKQQLAAELGRSERSIERWQASDQTFPVIRPYGPGLLARYDVAAVKAWLLSRAKPDGAASPQPELERGNLASFAQHRAEREGFGLTRKEIAAALEVPPWKIDSWRRHPTFPPVEDFFGVRLYRPAAVRAWLARRESCSSP